MKFVVPPGSLVRSSALMVALSLTYGCQDDGPQQHAVQKVGAEQPTIHRTIKIGPQHDVSASQDESAGNLEMVANDPLTGHSGFKLEPLPDSEPTLYEREAILDEEDIDTDFFADAESMMEQEDVEDAIVSYRKALGRDGENAEIWFKLGRAYSMLGQDSRGMECLEEAIDYKSDHAGAYSTMVRVMLDRGEDKSALSYAKTLRKIEPKTFRSAFLLGRSFARLKMWKESVAAFEDSLEEDPEHLWANNNLGYSALQIGEYEMAVFAYEVATGLEGAKPFMFNGLGYAYEKLGEPVHAMVAYDAAIDMNPRFVKALVNRERMVAALTPSSKMSTQLFN